MNELAFKENIDHAQIEGLKTHERTGASVEGSKRMKYNPRDEE